MLPLAACSQALTDVSELQEVMSVEQVTDYKPSESQLSLILSGVSIGAFVVLAAILVMQAATEARTAFAARRAAVARRLRYVKNDEEVVPLPVGEGRFHVFLSHTWAQVSPCNRLSDIAFPLSPLHGVAVTTCDACRARKQ